MRFLKALDKNFELVIMCIMLVLFTCVMFAQVIARYIIRSSILWADEFCRYCFITTIWFGCSYCIRARTHLRVDSILNAIPKKAVFWVDIFAELVTGVFFAIMFWASYLVTVSIYKVGSVSPLIELPQYILYGLMCFGFGLSAVRGIQAIVMKFMKRRSSEAPDGQAV